MDRIHYAGGSILTGSAIAEALLDFAQTLANVGESATVEIPARLPDGTMIRSKFVIGPASQLVSDSDPGETDELFDDELVADLKRRTEQTGLHSTSTVARPAAAEETAEWVDDDSL